MYEGVKYPQKGAKGLQGATGPAGIQGATGQQGIQGLIGPAGIQGETGQQGFQGLMGATGPAGAFNTSDLIDKVSIGSLTISGKNGIKYKLIVDDCGNLILNKITNNDSPIIITSFNDD